MVRRLSHKEKPHVCLVPILRRSEIQTLLLLCVLRVYRFSTEIYGFTTSGHQKLKPQSRFLVGLSDIVQYTPDCVDLVPTFAVNLS